MELTTVSPVNRYIVQLFMITKIQNLNGTHNLIPLRSFFELLFMITKIQNLNGTHNKAYLK